ncbi:hypothetical protein [uncultured Chitinophaga sp.]|uniref:hypothetical protein n=1 Tax=uncultured Chitinophaga sp. TaxID=339340 RepID=UPI0025E7A82B|nr:hypothetical protein [uncultured Chitinophaga sp.]
MKNEQYNLQIPYKGKIKEVLVNIHHINGNHKIWALVDGHEIVFQQDDHRDGLRPVNADQHVDPELCYQIGAAICKQRNGMGAGYTVREDFMENEY